MLWAVGFLKIITEALLRFWMSLQRRLARLLVDSSWGGRGVEAYHLQLCE